MRGSTIDQVRHDIDHAHTDMKVSEQIDEAEKAAGLQSMHPPKPDEEFGPWPVVCRGCRHFRRDHCRGGRSYLSGNSLLIRQRRRDKPGRECIASVIEMPVDEGIDVETPGRGSYPSSLS